MFGLGGSTPSAGERRRSPALLEETPPVTDLAPGVDDAADPNLHFSETDGDLRTAAADLHP
jgi:hypothetical protein